MRLLAQAITANREPPKSKIREPDTFDGSNPKKLRTFLVQCQLTFNDRPTTYANDRTKVNFAISYLSGTALSWFEPTLLNPPLFPPAWQDDYSAFKQELERHFGPYDPQGDAENAIENLVMKDNHRITKYTTDFYRLASEIHWDDASLRHRYYKNLPTRLKNEISRVGKPTTLHGMRDLAQAIDQRHWEREEEIRQENASRKPSGSNGNGNNHGNNSSNHSGNHSGNSNKKKPFVKNNSSSSNTHSGSSGNGSSASANSSSNKSASQSSAKPASDISAVLGKDGKLLPEERTRRIQNKLCLICGKPGHMASDCFKSRDSKAKARSAQLASNSDESSKK
jgi:hypothetical protein